MKIFQILLMLGLGHNAYSCSVECLPSGDCRYCHQGQSWAEKPGHEDSNCQVERHFICTSLD